MNQQESMAIIEQLGHQIDLLQAEQRRHRQQWARINLHRRNQAGQNQGGD